MLIINKVTFVKQLIANHFASNELRQVLAVVTVPVVTAAQKIIYMNTRYYECI